MLILTQRKCHYYFGITFEDNVEENIEIGIKRSGQDELRED